MAKLQGANIYNELLEREEGIEKIFKELRTEKFPNLMKGMNSKI